MAQDLPSGEIAYVTAVDGISQIFLMNVDGSNVRQLTDDEYPSYLPIWSPNGEHLLFSRQTGDRSPTDSPIVALWIMNANGENAVEINQDKEDQFILNVWQYVSWSPNNTKLLYSRYLGMFFETSLYNLETGESQTLPIGLGQTEQSRFLDNETLLTPVSTADLKGFALTTFDLTSGTTNEFKANGTLQIQPSFDRDQIVLERANTLRIISTTEPDQETILLDAFPGILPGEKGITVDHFFWSQDDSRIAGTITASSPDALESRILLFAVNADGSEYTAYEPGDRIFSMSPDGNYLVYTVLSIDGTYQLMISPADGIGTSSFITSNSEGSLNSYSQPAWRPNNEES